MTRPEPAPDDRSWRETFLLLPKPMRVTSYVVLGTVGALVVSMLMVVVLVRQALPQTGGELELDGLESPVTVVRDGHGIPQLVACPHRLTFERLAVLDDGGDHVCVTGRVRTARTTGSYLPLRVSVAGHLVPGHEADERAVGPAS